MVDYYVAHDPDKDAANFVTVKYTHYGEYRYFGSFLVSFGQRAAPTNDRNCFVARLWANDELIFDRQAGWYKPGLTFKFYPGTEDQEEIKNGFHYKGLMCVYFENFDLTDYGDQVPAMNAEILDAGEVINETSKLVGMDDNPRHYQELDPSTDRIVYLDHYTKQLGALTTSIQAARLSTKARSSYVVIPSLSKSISNIWTPDTILPNVTTRAVGLIAPSNLLLVQENTAEKTTDKQVFNTATGERLGVLGGLTSWQLAYGFRSDTSGVIDDYFMGWGTAATTVEVVYIRNGKPLAAGSPAAFASTPLGIARGRQLPGGVELLISLAGSVRLLVVGSGQVPTLNHTALYTPGAGSVYMTYFAPFDNTAIVLVKTSGNTGHAVKVDMSGAVIWTSADFTLPAQPSIKWKLAESSSNLKGGTLALKKAGVDGAITIIDLVDGTLTNETGLDTALPDDNTPVFWDSQSRIIYTNTRNYVKVNSPVAVPLNVGEVLRQFAVRAGYDNDDVFVSGMDDMPINGYVLTNASDLASISDGLAGLYGFNWVERAGQVLFSYHYDPDGIIDVTKVADAGRIANLTEALQGSSVDTIERTPDDPMPNAMSISYFDRNNNYELGYQSAKRSNFPHRTQSSVGKVDISLPIVLDGTTALSLIYGALYRVWGSKVGHAIRFPAEFMTLDPSDVLEFVAEGFQYQAQIVQTIINADNSVSLTLAEMASAAYPVVVAAQETLRPTKVPSGTPINCVVVDLPSLVDTDNYSGELNLTVYMGGYRENNFDGGRFEAASATDPGVWVGRAVVTQEQESYIGFIDDEIADIADPFVIDTTTVITVKRGNIPVSRFVTATDADMYTGKNQVVIGKGESPEIICFGVFNIIDDETVEVSRLLRGRFGTDVFVNTHSAGDFFVFMEHGQIVTYPAGQQGQSYFYRALGNGQPEWQADVQLITPLGNSRKPYAPFAIEGERELNGDVTLTWQRRARFFNSPPTDYDIDAMPLDEAAEQYVVEVYDTSWSVLLRQVNSVIGDGPTYTYTVNDQLADGTNEDEFYNVLVYQVSQSAVDRGFPGGGTLDLSGPVTFEGHAVGGGTAFGALRGLVGHAVGGGDATGNIAEPPEPPFAGHAVGEGFALGNIDEPGRLLLSDLDELGTPGKVRLEGDEDGNVELEGDAD